MRRRRLIIPQRRRVYLGCEGESERGYGARIGRLLGNRRRDVHLHVDLLRPGGGDPLALIDLARRRIAEGERKSESPYVHRAVLMDSDRLGQTPAPRRANGAHRASRAYPSNLAKTLP
jgi:hypothetical protein